MKIFTAIIVGSAFFAIAVLGFIAIGVEGEHAGCIAKTAFGAVCPDNTFAFIDFHLGALKSFSSGIAASILAAAFLIALFSLSLTAAPALHYLEKIRRAAFSRVSDDIKPGSYRRRLRSWISRSENSPNSF